MDRHYYYRLLGLTCEASTSQIKKAYEVRMAKLDSPDYADDPEYRQKKRAEATMAYRVLMGSAPVPTKGGKKKGFERFKEAIENKEGFDDDDCDVCVDEEDKPSFKDRFESALKKPATKKITFDTSRMNKKTVTSIIVSVFTILTCLFTVIGAIGGSSSLDFSQYEELESKVMFIEYNEDMSLHQKINYADQVDWNEGEDEYGDSDTYFATRDVLGTLGVDDADEFFYYITGEEYYYQDEDDQVCADTLINWLGAPEFDDIAGGENKYTKERILSHADYLEYLDECLWNNL